MEQKRQGVEERGREEMVKNNKKGLEWRERGGGKKEGEVRKEKIKLLTPPTICITH